MMRLLVIAAGFAAFSFFAPARPAAANPAAAAQSGEVLLLDFAASWCGPCKQMAPIVAEVASAGWVVRHVDVDRETDLVRRFGVTGVPCYVLLVKGHEVGRINGATTRGELENLLAKAAAPLGGTGSVAAPAPATDQPPIAGVPLPVAAADAHLATDSPQSSPARAAANEPTMPRSFVPVTAMAEPAAAASQAMPAATASSVRAKPASHAANASAKASSVCRAKTPP
jgi:thioredoxin-like negative regulator of GroEL